MKNAAVGPGEVYHRYLTPKWAFMPTSDAGAAMDGGRFNRPGVEALYLSRSPQTAFEEYRQGASITPPATLAAYEVTLGEVADLSEGFYPDHWDVAWAGWDCAWRQIARIDRKVPPSWTVADVVISKGLRGILFPSLRHAGGTNPWSVRLTSLQAIRSWFMIPINACRTINRPGREAGPASREQVDAVVRSSTA